MNNKKNCMVNIWR